MQSPFWNPAARKPETIWRIVCRACLQEKDRFESAASISTCLFVSVDVASFAGNLQAFPGRIWPHQKSIIASLLLAVAGIPSKEDHGSCCSGLCMMPTGCLARSTAEDGKSRAMVQ